MDVLSRRDYFAAMALSGLLANPCNESGHSDVSTANYGIVELSIDLADILIKQLDRNKDQLKENKQ